jgi:hypothetical protein
MSLIPSIGGTPGPQGPQGPPGATGGYNQYLAADTPITQTGTAGVANYMKLTTVGGNGIVVNQDPSGNRTEVTFSEQGIYSIQFSAQVRSSSSNQTVEFWVRRGGSIDIPWSNTRYALKGGNAEEVAMLNYVLPFSPGDYFQIVWLPSSSNVELYAESPIGIHPGIPSCILTVFQVGTF